MKITLVKSLIGVKPNQKAFSVTAVSTSSGVILYFKHPRFMTNWRLRLGQEPGLKSEAMATGTPASIISRTGAKVDPR